MNEFAALHDLAHARAPRCGSVRIVGIDGRSGAGKTHVGQQLAHDLDCQLISMEWVYPGWNGLASGIDAVAAALTQLTLGIPAQLPQWDWHTSQPAPPVVIAPQPLMVLEGVGAGAANIRPFLSALVWVDLSDDERYARAMARDGARYADWWDMWAAQETSYLASNHPQEHADVIVRTSHPPI